VKYFKIKGLRASLLSFVYRTL